MAERKAPFPNPPMCSTPHSDRAHTRASFQPRGCDVEPKQRDLGAPPPGFPSTPQAPQLPMSRGKPTHSRETPLLSTPIAQSFLLGVAASPRPRSHSTVPSSSRLRIGDIGRTGTSRLARCRSRFASLSEVVLDYCTLGWEESFSCSKLHSLRFARHSCCILSIFLISSALNREQRGPACCEDYQPRSLRGRRPGCPRAPAPQPTRAHSDSCPRRHVAWPRCQLSPRP